MYGTSRTLNDCSYNISISWFWQDVINPRFVYSLTYRREFTCYVSQFRHFFTCTNPHMKHMKYRHFILDSHMKYSALLYVPFFKVLAQIEDKHRRLPEVRARQGSTANTSTLQRLLHSFEQDIQLLVTQVRQHEHEQTAYKITCFRIHWPQFSCSAESQQLTSMILTLQRQPTNKNVIIWEK